MNLTFKQKDDDIIIKDTRSSYKLRTDQASIESSDLPITITRQLFDFDGAKLSPASESVTFSFYNSPH